MEETNTQESKSLLKLDVTIVICSMLVLISAIIGYCYYNIRDRELMANNIENAIQKGIDPMTVRCSYAKIDDTICVAFAITHTSTSNPAVTLSKK